MITVPPPPATWAGRLRWTLADAWTITRRDLAHLRNKPGYLVGMTAAPMAFIAIFGYIFGSAVELPGGNYRAFMMPGIFAMTTAFGAVGTMVVVATEMSKGVIDRFRSLPMSRAAVLLGRVFSDLLLTLPGLTLMVIAGYLIGWRAENGPAGALAAFGLMFLLRFALTWLGAYVAMLARTPESADQIGSVVIFPLTMVGNTFVPTGGMPGWLRVIADWNPISALTAAFRVLFGNPGVPGLDAPWPLRHCVAVSAGWAILLIVVFLPLAVRRYLRLSG
ncbi:transport permease protein [Sphaerisporangium krabiense]|uniref:Transport permease protein n=1 Tax=Sphaerisporangium krabiense TaxID=763782 RepID=A0A7W9DR25_9ACTN|nr:ABC transporter permease [Sphaerisporangium krabiense]MBB5626980.1 ABC-2 type transport system permease protein [Sphaerisporangium krabiense]GII66783.1 transport permease protein [Sphaerisporangium krabiense]